MIGKIDCFEFTIYTKDIYFLQEFRVAFARRVIMSGELLEEFEHKRESIRDIVEDHVRKRDKLAEESQKNAQERDILNAKVRELRDIAKQKIAEKSALIEQIQKLREEKEEHFKKLSEYRKEFHKIKGEVDIQGIDMRDIRSRERELQRLEIRQQTTQLGKADEQKIISEIRRLTNEIKKMKQQFNVELESNDRVKEVTTQIKQEKKTAEEFKKHVDEISTNISKLSEEINTLLQTLDETRRQADEFHEQFIKYSQESEKEHEAFLKAKGDLRDLEKAIYSMRTKDKTTKKKEKEGELQKKATILYDKFKNGEQLTTEDLLILQKAGFL